MASPEQRGGIPNPEREPTPYYRAASFASEPPAAQAYGAIEELLFAGPEVDLSAYRLLLESVSHVIVLGTPPPLSVERRLETILSAGDPATLAPEVLSILHQRRQQARSQGSWVERHYRPGKRI